MSHKNFYATINLNRAANQRSDNKWVSEQLKKPESKILPVWRNQNLFTHGDNFSMACLDIEHLSVFSNGKNQPILLGMIGQTSYFSIDISHLDNPKDKILFNSLIFPRKLKIVLNLNIENSLRAIETRTIRTISSLRFL